MGWSAAVETFKGSFSPVVWPTIVFHRVRWRLGGKFLKLRKFLEFHKMSLFQHMHIDNCARLLKMTMISYRNKWKWGKYRGTAYCIVNGSFLSNWRYFCINNQNNAVKMIIWTNYTGLSQQKVLDRVGGRWEPTKTILVTATTYADSL